jgi:hypothetical protein
MKIRWIPGVYLHKGGARMTERTKIVETRGPRVSTDVILYEEFDSSCGTATRMKNAGHREH